ncbi:hypothetical protein [Sporosarcina sp. ITBMC105]
MDNKEKQLFAYYYKQFAERSFDEKDVLAFLLFAKKHAQANKVLNELGQFLVQREQMTGYVKSYFDHCQEIIQNLGKGKKEKIENLFSFKEIRNQLNAFFVEQGFDKLSPEVINDIMLCMIALLQDVKLISRTTNKKVGHLSFAASSKELFLMGNMRVLHKGRFIPITFPVLTARNSYEKVTPRDQNDTPYLFDDALIEVMNHEGQLVITFPTMN